MKWMTLGFFLIAATLPRPAASALLPSVGVEFQVRLHAGADEAFPLFDPIREASWAPGWAPRFISSASVEPGLVFTTEEHGTLAIWILDQYDPKAHFLRYVNVRNGSELNEFNIRVEPVDASNCTATVRLRRTALVASSAEDVLAFGRHAGAQGPHWEAAINWYLDRAKR
jgi:hypothetical protein